jgi:hypothetical protein
MNAFLHHKVQDLKLLSYYKRLMLFLFYELGMDSKIQ